ncbi:MAG: alkaline phosphatase family protein [Gemmatimonadaceae bacterium]|nr:alkaline phosphatase family protein [Gemmatimonadaceae bacterium]
MTAARRAGPLLLLAAALLSGFTPVPGPQAPAPRPRTVVLISLDGFRWDFLQRPAARRLRALAARGVRPRRMIPAFPSKTFPNHYTLVTGLYPEEHGIAANVMRDSVLGRFATGNDPAVRDARWFGGEPIWVTAERQGLRTATYFWPGSEAPIGGLHPHWYYAYDGATPNSARVSRVLEWLAMPDSAAPRLIAVYFSDVDTDAHNHGPDSPEADSAIARVDSAVGAILDGIDRLRARSRVDVVVVSDHGMAEIEASRTISLDDYVSLDSLDIGDWSPVATIIPKPGAAEYVYRALLHAHPHLQVYRKGELPARLHYNTGARVTPIVAIADEGWSIGTREYNAKQVPGKVGGAHGYDPQVPSMGALFIGAGPDFRRGRVVAPFSNVHVYPLLARLLRVLPAASSGSLDSVRTLLR